ncbi:succinylglutamate desuccinylase/aspartoacylase family protein [Mangrovivirga cuniculi]|nr:succinylglutamate desuccinylase/aspartoacylase family protein [Mangrovivirga cuniculi]
MVELTDQFRGHKIKVGRLIGKIEGKKEGPSMIFTGGIHGNEPSGVFAIREVIEEISRNKIKVRGNIYGISGNLKALGKGHRYEKYDLNRLWTKKKIESLLNDVQKEPAQDIIEQKEILTEIRKILNEDNGPFYFFDLHTTSSETNPFLTVNDCLANRKFAELFPVPMILGIEEYLEGPLLSYINELGYVAFGFEGGSHGDKSSVDNHKAFILLALVHAGMIKRKSFNYYKYYDQLAKTSFDSHEIFEIFYRFQVFDNSKFKMKPGFVNFQKIKQGTILAKYNGERIKAEENARIFMPLYQNQGDDGFFLIRKVSPFFLKLSEKLRTLKVDKILPVLPGVKWHNKEKDTLEVNTTIAKFFAKRFFHLLGFRAIILGENKYLMKNREKAVRSKDYKNEKFFQ